MLAKKVPNTEFRIKKISGIEQVIMMYGGLRGGVAFALVLSLKSPHKYLFVTTTLAMVYFTVFFQGITIKPLVRLLRVKTRTNTDPSMTERVTNRLMDLAKLGIGDILGEQSEIPLRTRRVYKNFDEHYLQRLLLRDRKPEPKFQEKIIKIRFKLE